MLASMDKRNLTPERRKQIAKAAASARWRSDAPETTRISVTVRRSDVELLAKLREKLGEASDAAVVRRLIRAEAKRP